MGRVLRGGLVAIVVVVVIAVLTVGGLLAALTAAGQPQLSGTRQVVGLGDDVQISRDENGVTQIAAANQHDLFFAQGWVHASERMWQMEIWRRIGAGRLSELFGESQLETDTFIRTLDWRGAAARDLEALSEDSRTILQAYADGVNAYLADHQGSLGVAFTVAGLLSGGGSGLDGLRPEPWTPLDTLTWAKVQAWGLGGNMDSEIFRMLVDARLGDPALTDELFPAYSADQPVIAAPEDGSATGAKDSAGSADSADSADSAGSAAGGGSGVEPSAGIALADAGAGAALAADPGAWLALARVANAIPALAGLAPARDLVNDGGVGSNNWVVGPSRSATGTALLANDPHLGFNMPSVWYVNGLHCRPVAAACPYDVAGVTFPGTPGVVAGHNARIAWGVTNAGPDVQDLVEEKVDPADPTRYLSVDGSVPFTVRTETIRVAGGDDVTLTVRETSHGPVLNDADARLRDASALYTLRWTALAVPDRVLEAFLTIDRASDWTSFRDALRLFGAPSQNFVYADADGHIGYQMPGAIPVRTDPADQGLRPVPGWDGQHEWEGFVPFDDLPTVFDPPSGRIVTANNRIDGGDVFLGVEFDRGDRAARITELLDAAGAGVTLDTMATIQGDTLLRRAPRLTAGLLDLRPTPATADGVAVFDAIARWNGRCDTSSVGCSAYLTFELALERALYDDELGPQARDYIGSDYAQDLAATLVGTPEGRASAWWGDRRAGTGASAGDVVARAMDTAGAWLRRDLGGPSSWTWGRIHRIAFRESTLGVSGIGPLEWYFDTSPAAVDGAGGAVDNTYYRLGRGYADPADPGVPVADTLPELFDVTNGPSMRALYDMGNLDAGRIITTTGQSGQPFSRHADDWVGRWLRNQTVPLPFTDPAIDRASAAALILQPAP
ncbi:MAG: penicillin acylase family protein [Candidatus Limnocylindrales bacterium]